MPFPGKWKTPYYFCMGFAGDGLAGGRLIFVEKTFVLSKRR
jgi:hypothetical protein